MSWISEQREQRRADQVAAAEQARLDADAAVTRRLAERAARAEQARADQAAAQRERQAAKDKRRDRRKALVAALRVWATAHMVDLLIYPLAIASAVMAVPAMAAWGMGTYRDATGAVLPVLSELGMWAFALAVMVSRRLHPGGPVWALQAGIGVFALYGAALNFGHGMQVGGIDTGMVMAAVSIAGVVAHQLVTASPRRSRIERAAARIERQAARKVAKIRRAAIDHAVAEIDPTGAVSLIVAPGRYVLAKGQLEHAIVPGLPVDPADTTSTVADELADEVTAWLASTTNGTHPGGPRPDRPDRPHGTGPIGTLDPGPNPHAESSTEPHADRGADVQRSTPIQPPATKRGKAPGKAPRTARTGRTLDQLRTDLAAALADESTSIDPTSAESIRKALRCSPARARQLRDEHRHNHPEGNQR